MTDREKAIVQAYTGVCMLTDEKFQIFHKYIEDIMGRPVWTHEMALDPIADEIRAKSKDDFITLCANESSSEKPDKWIPVSERLPENNENVIVTDDAGGLATVGIDWLDGDNGRWWYSQNVTAWMPLPMAYVPDTNDGKMNADNLDKGDDFMFGDYMSPIV